MGPSMMNGGVAWMTFSSVLLWMLIFGGVVAIVVFAIRQTRPAHPTAREVLDQRYARGDIDDEEYRTRLHALRQG
jgi:putative membrane protein